MIFGLLLQHDLLKQELKIATKKIKKFHLNHAPQPTMSLDSQFDTQK